MESKQKELRVPPEPLVVVYLDEIAGRLAELTEVQQKVLTHLQETTPEGKDMLIFEGSVDPPVKGVDPIRGYPYHRLFRAQVINKGTNTVYARVNGEKEIPLEPDEEYTFEKSKALIEYITLRVEAATTVKILGRY